MKEILAELEKLSKDVKSLHPKAEEKLYSTTGTLEYIDLVSRMNGYIKNLKRLKGKPKKLSTDMKETVKDFDIVWKDARKKILDESTWLSDNS